MEPFLGKKGSDAVAAVLANGTPVITVEDANLISNGAFNNTYSIVGNNFNAASITGISFSQLPAEAQTVIVDVAYPSGPYLNASAPVFWSAVTAGNWQAAVNELNHWYSNGTSDNRHTDDANKLQSAIDSKILPNTSPDGVCP